MPASLYRLANKPHHADAQSSVIEAKLETQVEQAAPEESSAPQIADLVAAPEPPAPTTENEPTASETPTWDPSWTKTQLLDFAIQLGLPVTSANTKTQIIESLTSASSS